MINFVSAANSDINPLFGQLGATAGGLTDQEAALRQKNYGKNILTSKKGNLWEIFFRQFNNAFLYLLIGASIVSFFLGEQEQGITILAIIFLTSVLGFFLEYRSQKAEEKLAFLLKESCWVKRNNQKITIDKTRLVPGDIVLLQSGDIVPADCRLVSQENLQLDESALTGESVPVRKTIGKLQGVTSINKASNLLFAGTALSFGTAEAVVFATGFSTEIGRITKLVSQAGHKSSFEQALKSVSNFILRLTIVALVVIFLANVVLKGRGADMTGLFLFTVALAISIVPEALPVVSMFTMSIGALNLAKKKAIVKRLTALEDLGNIQVLCVDKTGTLTENKLIVSQVVSHDKKNFWSFFTASVKPILSDKGQLRSYLDEVVYRHVLEQKITISKSELIVDEPFRADLRQDRIAVKKEGKNYLITKGAPEIILKNCSYQEKNGKKIPTNSSEWRKILQTEAEQGRRAYGLSIKEISDKEALSLTKNTDWNNKLDEFNHEGTFLGFVSFYDPIKKTALQAVKKASELGVKVKILTGDSAEVAAWVGIQIGLIQNADEVIRSEKLQNLNEKEFKETVLKNTVFSRVNPEQKYKIVKVLQEDYWTAFLGDGINDAPALKLANVSLVVSNASEIAKEAADVILLRKDLQVIMIGIEQGRRIFSNVLKYIQYTLASNFGNSYSLALISLLLPFLPMLPVQILLVNLLSDFPLISVATDRVDASQIKNPVNFDLKQSGFLIVSLGVISMVFDFLFFAVFRTQPAAFLQTLWFMESVLSENIFILSIRSRLPFYKAVAPSLPLLILLVVTTITTVLLPFSFLAGSFGFVKPQLHQIAIVFVLVIAYFITTETAKLIYYRKFNSQQPSLC